MVPRLRPDRVLEDPSGNVEVYAMNANGAGVTRPTDSAGPDDWRSWSPDGTKIAFASTRDSQSPFYEIYVMNADGTGATRLTDDPNSASRPVWSPDGSKLAFESLRDGDGEIYVMSADGAWSISPTTPFLMASRRGRLRRRPQPMPGRTSRQASSRSTMSPGTTPINPGAWHRIEFYYKWETTPGVSGDGIIRWWVDGTLNGNHTTVHYPSQRGFMEFQHAPTIETAPPAEQYMYIDQTRVSVR